MKITIEVDMTPQEARDFLGLPNVEGIHQQLAMNAEKYLSGSSTGEHEEIIAMAMQPMLAYQEWLRRVMSDGTASKAGKRGGDK
jgi:hypothetical protein